MSQFATQFRRLLRSTRQADDSTSKGKSLEDLIAFLFGAVRGMTVTDRNVLNAAGSEEVDIVFWNDKLKGDLPFMPYIIMVECKNWSSSLTSQEVAWFDHKLRDRSQTKGVLVAANGITGNASSLTSAHDIISKSLRDGIEIIVLTLDELSEIQSTASLVTLMKRKLCSLAARGTSLPWPAEQPAEQRTGRRRRPRRAGPATQ